MHHPNASCEACRQNLWSATLQSSIGLIYLCTKCVTMALHDRNSKIAVAQDRFTKLVDRINKRRNKVSVSA